jgi:hypothetical protein
MMPILANVITADMGLIPGLAIVSPLLGLPLSVMAAVIERPLLSAAGLRRHAVWYSIQANVVSLLVGYPLVLIVAALADVFGDESLMLWPFATVAISAAVEWAYLNWRAACQPRLHFGRVLGGNMVSALACLLLFIPLLALNQPQVRNALRPYQLSLNIALGVICLIAVVAAFLVPHLADRSTAARKEAPAPAISGDPNAA